MSNIVPFEVDDTSPAVIYSPFADTLSTPNLLAGWNPYFTSSGFASSPGQEGDGNSLHITALDGASLSLAWHGTGIQLFGNATQASYTIILDGAPMEPNANPTSNILAAFTSLSDTNHNISLVARTRQTTDSFIAFDKFRIMSPPTNNTNATKFTTQTLPASAISFTGAWTFVNSTDFLSSAHQSTTEGDRAETEFIGSSFFLRGTTSPSAGQFTVTLDGNPTTLSARSSFLQPDTLLYFASGLTFNETHTVQVLNVDGALLTLRTNGFSVISEGDPVPPEATTSPLPLPSSTGSTSQSFPPGTIAAFVLAGILGFILLALLLACCLYVLPRWRRKRRRQQEDRAKEMESGNVLDIGPSGPVTTNGASARRESGGNNHERWWDRGNHRDSRDKRLSGKSGKSGFARWKEEVEGGFNGRGLGGLGLAFRHSLSVGGGGTVRSHELSDEEHEKGDTNGVKLAAADITETKRAGTDDSPQDVVENGGKGKGRAWGMMGKKRKSKDASPTFALDLPLPALPHNGGHPQSPSHVRSRSNSGSVHSTLLSLPQSRQQSQAQICQPQQRQPPQSQRETESSPALSYISTPTPPSTGQTPSSQVPTSQTYVSAASQTPTPEANNRPTPSPHVQLPVHVVERPLPAPPPRPLPVPTPPRSHGRSPSSGFLLHQGVPNIESPDDDTYEPVPFRPTASPPPTLPELAQTTSIPPHFMVQGDRGSVVSGTPTLGEGVVMAGTSSGQSALRGLSPRTSESESQPGSQRERARGTSPGLKLDIEATRERSDNGRPVLLDVGETSPFNVDFSSPSEGLDKDTVRMSGMSHVRFHGRENEPVERSPSEESPTGPTIRRIRALPRIPVQPSTFRLTPPSIQAPPVPSSPDRSDSEGVTSFLDFGGSSEGSFMTQSNDSQNNQKSRWSSTTGNSMITSLHRVATGSRPATGTLSRHEQEAIEEVTDQPGNSPTDTQNSKQSNSSGKRSDQSNNFPFPVSLPPSPHHPPGHYTRDLSAGSREEGPSISSLSVIARVPRSSSLRVRPHHPSGLPAETTSPTDSIPMSVSDIHFRHSDSESSGGSASRRGSPISQLPPHPPLPGSAEGDSDLPLPPSTTSSEYIVQRVLGISPTTAQPEIGHARAGSAGVVVFSPLSREEAQRARSSDGDTRYTARRS